MQSTTATTPAPALNASAAENMRTMIQGLIVADGGDTRSCQTAYHSQVIVHLTTIEEQLATLISLVSAQKKPVARATAGATKAATTDESAEGADTPAASTATTATASSTTTNARYPTMPSWFKTNWNDETSTEFKLTWSAKPGIAEKLAAHKAANAAKYKNVKVAENTSSTVCLVSIKESAELYAELEDLHKEGKGLGVTLVSQYKAIDEKQANIETDTPPAETQ